MSLSEISRSKPPSPLDSDAKPVPIASSRRGEHIGGIDSPNRWLKRENQRGIDPSLRRVFEDFRPLFATSECSDKLGLSLELGSFVAGIMISTTDFAQQTLDQVIRAARDMWNKFDADSGGIEYSLRKQIRQFRD